MQITVSGKNLNVSDALREHVEKKLSKLTARFDNIVTANVILSTDNRKKIVEATLNVKGSESIHGTDDSEDMYRSINNVVDKLERQLSKNRQKPLAVAIKGVSKDGERIPAPIAAPVEEVAPKQAPGVVKTVAYTAEPLTVIEAVKALEEKGHVFYTFFNTENERINVVYTTDRGICLLDPKVPE